MMMRIKEALDRIKIVGTEDDVKVFFDLLNNMMDRISELEKMADKYEQIMDILDGLPINVENLLEK